MNIKGIYFLCWFFILIGWVVVVHNNIPTLSENGGGHFFVLFFSSIGMLYWWSFIDHQEKMERIKTEREAQRAEREAQREEQARLSGNFGDASYATAEERKSVDLVSED